MGRVSGKVDSIFLITNSTEAILFQIWRIITALFYYPTGFHFLLNCYFLYDYSVRLETHFRGSPSEYFFLLIFNWICCVVIGLIASFPVSHRLLLYFKKIILFEQKQIAPDGSDGIVDVICLVSTEQKRDG